jgi:hypothetical protein
MKVGFEAVIDLVATWGGRCRSFEYQDNRGLSVTEISRHARSESIIAVHCLGPAF